MSERRCAGYPAFDPAQGVKCAQMESLAENIFVSQRRNIVQVHIGTRQPSKGGYCRIARGERYNRFKTTFAWTPC